ncbi:MAG: TIGR02281 family clan AA aspartic protease [Rhodosalinus sp.]|uniref:retropepsin-like aspartic protease family protein n=1 Tax=Rhodosalinus sp. TaxID=2047741 RepID=UPI00397D3362
MTGDQIAQLTYLALLGAAIGFWVLMRMRGGFGQLAQYAAVWGLIFLGVIAAVGLWGDIRQTVSPQQSVAVSEGRITVPRSADGHYYLTLEVNGTPTRFMVDTGATEVVLTHEAARRAGIDTDGLAYFGRALTANGEVATAPVRLESIGAGALTERGFRAWVNSGEMPEPLLGMSYLNRFERIEIADGELVLVR